MVENIEYQAIITFVFGDNHTISNKTMDGIKKDCLKYKYNGNVESIDLQKVVKLTPLKIKGENMNWNKKNQYEQLG